MPSALLHASIHNVVDVSMALGTLKDEIHPLRSISSVTKQGISVSVQTHFDFASSVYPTENRTVTAIRFSHSYYCSRIPNSMASCTIAVFWQINRMKGQLWQLSVSH